MKRYFSIFLFLFALAPGLAAAEEAPGANGSALRAFLARSSDPAIPRDFVAKVLKEAGELEARGIPSEPYLLKANEGLAKGVMPAKIEPVLGQTRRSEESAAAWVDRMGEGNLEKNSSARRAAILQVHAAMLNGKSTKDLEKAFRASENGARPSWESIESKTREMQPRRHVDVGSGVVAPTSSTLAHRPQVKDTSKDTEKVPGEAKEKSSVKSKTFEKDHGRPEKPEKLKRENPRKPNNTSHGPKSSHGRGKGK